MGLFKKSLCLFLLATLALLLMHVGLAGNSEGKAPDGRYHNRYIDAANGAGFFKWQWQRWTSPDQRAPAQAIVGVSPNLRLIHSTATSPRATWIGHASVLYQIDGLNILTDPQWSERASPVDFAGPKRVQPPGLAWQDLPHIDYVLISHNHYDHLDFKTVQKLMQQADQPPIFLVPAGVEHWFHQNVKNSVLNGEGANVVGLQWWQEVSVAGQHGLHRLRFLPVQHWSARSLFDRYETLWGSWAVLSPDFTFWFSGDLGYSQDIRDIHANIGDVDLAAIAIGGYAPRWFMQRAHIDPDEAVQVMQDLHAKQALAIHWGTFALTDEPLDEPPKRLQQALQRHALAAQRFRVLRHGETMLMNGDGL